MHIGAANMLAHLDTIYYSPSDDATFAYPALAHQEFTGSCPCIYIAEEVLPILLDLRGPAHLAQVLGCSARTVWRTSCKATEQWLGRNK